jgi:iron complex outermembrane receptor protein
MKMENRKSLIKAMLSGGCAVAALTVSGTALAQATPQAAAASASGGVEEIVVTAQRRTERLENVPASVTALTSNTLEKAQVVNVHDIQRVAAGVQINFAGVSTQPAIRGVTSLTNGSGNENNVAIYVDGFYISDNLTINQDLANLAGIEVLKGPQGTLYGRNATGGAILVRTLDPTEQLSGKFEGSYGKLSEKKLSGYISGPLSDKVGFMVAGSFRDNHGWIKLSVPGNPTQTSGYANPQKQRSFRAKLKAELSDTVTATAAYNYSYTSDTSGNLFSTFQYQPVNVPGTGTPAAAPVFPAVPYAGSGYVSGGFGTAAGNGKNIAAGRTNQATLKLEWETPYGKLTSYTGYDKRKIRNDFDFDGSYYNQTFSEGFPKFRAFQENVDYNITAIKNLDLIVGGNYFNEKSTLINRTLSYGVPTLSNLLTGAARSISFENHRGLKTDAYAFYIDATYHITEKLAIGAGGRYSHDKKFQSLVVEDGAGGLHLGVNGLPTDPYQSSSFSSSKFTPRATIRYEVADRSNVYFSYSQGFRAASFNASAANTAAAVLPIKPETIDSYEVGFKTARRWIRAEIEGFYYNYKNLNTSLTVPNPLNPLAPTTIVGNAPKATIKGVDMSVTVTPVERLNITANAEYLHARYGHFPNSVGNGINAALTANVTGQMQDWSGKQMSRSPDFSGNIQGDYTVPVAGGELTLSGNVRYTASYVVNNPSLYGPLAPANLAGEQRYRQKAFTLVDGEIDWYGPDHKYWIGVYGQNLTNKSYRLSYNGGAYGDYSTKAEPITYGVKAGYQF